jgi:hypothetical protein
VNQRTFLVRQVEEVGVERGPATLVNHPLLVDREKRAARKRAASRKGTAALASKCSANRMCRASARRLMTTRQRRWCARHFPREKRVEFSTAPSQGAGSNAGPGALSCMASGLVRRRTFVACWASGLDRSGQYVSYPREVQLPPSAVTKQISRVDLPSDESLFTLGMQVGRPDVQG